MATDVKLRVLFLETSRGNGDTADFFLRGLNRKTFEIMSLREPEQIYGIAKMGWDLVLLDLDQGGGRKAEYLEKLNRALPAGVPVLDLAEGVRSDPMITTALDMDGKLPKITVSSVGLMRALGHVLQRRNLEMQIERLQERIDDIERTDPTSGVWTRAYFEERLEEQFVAWRRYQTPMAFALFEIQGFNAYNEKYGHAMADRIVRGVGEAIRKVKRDSDFSGMLTPSRYAIAFVNTPISSAVIGVERVAKALQEQVFEGTTGDFFTVQLCAGVTQFGPRHEQMRAIFTSARAALDAARERGSGAIHIDAADAEALAGQGTDPGPM